MTQPPYEHQQPGQQQWAPPPQQPYQPSPPMPPRPRTPVMVKRKYAFIGAGVAFVIGLGIGGAAAANDPAEPVNPAARATVTVTATPPPAKTTPAPAAPARPAKVTMPNVVGKNGAIAQARLEKLGIRNINWGSADPSASTVLLVSNWKVTKQEPKAGAKVRPGDPVVLTAVKLQ